MNIFNSTIALLWIVWLIYWLISAIFSKRNSKKHNWLPDIILRVGIFLIVILFLRIPFLYGFLKNIHSQSLHFNLWINILGLLLFLLGFGLSIWARLSIGKNWGMPMSLKKKPELVTTGPYKYIRHPIYTGLMLSMLGTSMDVTIFWVIPFVMVSIYFVYSSKVEEKDMIKQFPKEYNVYKKRTKSLIPFIY